MLDDLQFISEQLSASATSDREPPTFEAFLRTIVPPNWWPLTNDERSRTLRMVQSVPICLLWVPRASVIRTVVATDGKSERDATLVACAPQIFDDLELLGEKCDRETLVELTDAFAEAVAAARAGLHRSAQALCASIITAILTDHYAVTRFDYARTQLEQEAPGRSRLRFWRRASIQSALLGAIAQNWPDDPPPEGFNRHRTAHSVSTAQYTDAHAVEALLLVGGLLRELTEIYSTGHGGVPPASRISG